MVSAVFHSPLEALSRQRGAQRYTFNSCKAQTQRAQQPQNT